MAVCRYRCLCVTPTALGGGRFIFHFSLMFELLFWIRNNLATTQYNHTVSSRIQFCYLSRFSFLHYFNHVLNQIEKEQKRINRKQLFRFIFNGERCKTHFFCFLLRSPNQSKVQIETGAARSRSLSCCCCCCWWEKPFNNRRENLLAAD